MRKVISKMKESDTNAWTMRFLFRWNHLMWNRKMQWVWWYNNNINQKEKVQCKVFSHTLTGRQFWGVFLVWFWFRWWLKVKGVSFHPLGSLLSFTIDFMAHGAIIDFAMYIPLLMIVEATKNESEERTDDTSWGFYTLVTLAAVGACAIIYLALQCCVVLVGRVTGKSKNARPQYSGLAIEVGVVRKENERLLKEIQGMHLQKNESHLKYLPSEIYIARGGSIYHVVGCHHLKPKDSSFETVRLCKDCDRKHKWPNQNFRWHWKKLCGLGGGADQLVEQNCLKTGAFFPQTVYCWGFQCNLRPGRLASLK